MKSGIVSVQPAIALERFDGANGESCGAYKCGKIMMFVNVHENLAPKLNELSEENVQLKSKLDNLASRLAKLEANK